MCAVPEATTWQGHFGGQLIKETKLMGNLLMHLLCEKLTHKARAAFKRRHDAVCLLQKGQRCTFAFVALICRPGYAARLATFYKKNKKTGSVSGTSALQATAVYPETFCSYIYNVWLQTVQVKSTQVPSAGVLAGRPFASPVVAKRRAMLPFGLAAKRCRG